MSSIKYLLGKRYIELATKWVPSATTFGAAGAILVTYITDWRLIMDYVPYYSGKFKDEE